MELYVIRHGATESNENGIWQGSELNTPLCGKGRDQARAIGGMLAGRGIERVFASDLARAQETAAILSRRIGVPVETVEALREVKLGAWSGMTREEAYAAYPEFLQHPERLIDSAPPGGETQLDVLARAQAAFAGITACGLSRVAVVSHGALLRTWFCAAMGMPLENRDRIVLQNGAVAHFTYDELRHRYRLHALTRCDEACGGESIL